MLALVHYRYIFIAPSPEVFRLSYILLHTMLFIYLFIFQYLSWGQNEEDEEM